jgi:hypothetical protein
VKRGARDVARVKGSAIVVPSRTVSHLRNFWPDLVVESTAFDAKFDTLEIFEGPYSTNNPLFVQCRGPFV